MLNPKPLSTRPIGDKTHMKLIKVSLSYGIITLISTIISNALRKKCLTAYITTK